MKYINLFKNHSSYEEKLNGGGVDISLPNVSYCEDVKDVHYTPYNLVRFYVGEITPPQTVKIYTDKTTSIPIQVSESNKWYTCVLPKGKGLYKIEGDSVQKVAVKADININGYNIISDTTVEASFKGSDTSNVTNMASMFEGCESLTSLDVSNFDTSNVTDMSNMFNYCNGLTSLDVSNFNTSSVTNMNSMFLNCIDLTSLDLSNFNTSNVTGMSYMFENCESLTSLDVSNFNTSNVTSMRSMFSYCTSLTSLDVSNFNTSNVTNMNSMFQYCYSLTSLDLSGLDTSNVTTIDFMFRGCTELKTIRMVGCLGATITKIQNQLAADGITGVTIVTE